MWEIVCVVLSMTCIITLAIILKIYDGRLLSEWNAAIPPGNDPLNISINTIVSIIGTVSKSLLIASIGSGLSQSKWIWFASRKRSLLDFKAFEDASRDPLGSLRLLPLTRLR